jgi:hypothetical protein
LVYRPGLGIAVPVNHGSVGLRRCLGRILLGFLFCVLFPPRGQWDRPGQNHKNTQDKRGFKPSVSAYHHKNPLLEPNEALKNAIERF